MPVNFFGNVFIQASEKLRDMISDPHFAAIFLCFSCLRRMDDSCQLSGSRTADYIRATIDAG